VQGCRTTTDDIERWANTANGPRKLVAVLSHEKYPLELRVEAAMTLVRMKPRGGRRVGIESLTAALADLAPAERARIVGQLVPRLESEIRKPAPKPTQPPAADPSTPYKDAAFALLTHADGTLVENQDSKTRLRAALADWAMTNFAERMDDSSAMFGMEQVLRHLGAQGVRRLPDMIDPNAKKIDRMADLIAELGSPEAKTQASGKLVAIAKEVSSERWIEQKKPQVDAANKSAKLNPNPAQFRQQLEQFQEEELLRIFTALKRVGGAPAVDFLIDFAKNTSHSEKKRASAMAALEGHLDKNNPRHVSAMLDIATAKDTPDAVRDGALRRVGEMPRKQVVGKLYELFSHENWKVRWVAAELVLRMSDTTHVDEFMKRIGEAEGMSITEPLRYGAILGEMKGATPPEKLVEKYVEKNNPVQARLSALGYYYERGTKADLAKVDRFSGDTGKVPECKKEAKECEWKCAVAAGGAQEEKEIKTVGDFVTHCVKPAMEKRTQAAPTKETK
jgi:hypothetical protein